MTSPSGSTLTPEQIIEVLNTRVAAVLKQRKDIKVPSLTEGPVAVLEAVRNVRTRLDLMEENISELIRLRGSLRRVARRAQDDVDDKWAQTVTSPGRRPARGDFSDPAPRERYAEADLAVLNERRAQRIQAELAERASEAVEVSQLAYRGASDIRRDLHVMLRGIEIENSLER